MELPLGDLISLISTISIWSVVKVMVCFALLIYVGFAFIIIRQVNMMIHALSGQLELLLKFISWAHFLGAVLILLAAIFVL